MKKGKTLMLKDRLPTEFEMKILTWLIKRKNIPLGNKQVKYVAAALRLERLGYVEKGTHWYVTKKGKAILAEVGE